MPLGHDAVPAGGARLEALERAVRAFVIDNFLFGEDDGTLAGDDSLLENGVMDSTGVLELVAHLEQTYGIQVHHDEILPENLDSICRVAIFLARRIDEGTTHDGSDQV